MKLFAIKSTSASVFSFFTMDFILFQDFCDKINQGTIFAVSELKKRSSFSIVIPHLIDLPNQENITNSKSG